ncbi:WD40 repeat domain-containing protein, partial [Salmonella sp. SAL4458]|uniref:WD40 repeat domain-containing protein n=1 Tax=Salmonella sp. SAL4458 TaxID=3159913 RepID=UPI00397CD1E8
LERKTQTFSREVVALSPDGSRVAAVGEEFTVAVWDVAAGQVSHTLRGHTDHVHALAYSPDGRTLASAGADRTIRLWDAEG